MRDTKYTWHGVMVALACAVVLWGFPLWGQATGTAPSAKQTAEEQDTRHLAETLERLDMGLLLEELAEQTGDRTIRIAACRSRLESVEAPELRATLLEELEGLIRVEVQHLQAQLHVLQEDPTRREEYEETLIASLRARQEWIRIRVLHRGRVYIDKLGFMLAGPRDRRALSELVSDVWDEQVALEDSLQEQWKRARKTPENQLWLVPKLEELRTSTLYIGAFLRYYAAVTGAGDMTDEGEKKTVAYSGRTETEGWSEDTRRRHLLHEAESIIEPFATDRRYGVQSHACLLLGRCYRELEKFDQAAKWFAQAAEDDTDRAVAVEAMFEQTRNRIEQGVLALRQGGDPRAPDAAKTRAAEELLTEARASVDGFAKQARKVQPPLGVDVKAMVLRHVLHTSWSEACRATGDPEQAALQSRQADEAIVEFLGRYRSPSVRMAVARLCRGPFLRSGDDQGNEPRVLLFLGLMDLAAAEDLLAESSVEDLPEKERTLLHDVRRRAMARFEAVLATDEADTPDAHADALWFLGVMHARRDEKVLAAERFRDLVQHYPEHPRASTAAMNALRITSGLIAGRVGAGHTVPARLREELVASLRVMLQRRPEEPQADRYHVDLARQCEMLARTAETPQKAEAWRDEAARHYAMVSPTSEVYPAARFGLLEVRFERLRRAEASSAGRRVVSLVRELKDFSRQMRRASSLEADPSRQADLERWGAASEFHAHVLEHEVLGRSREALTAIEQLPQRWSGVEILRRSREYAIRARLEQDDVESAVQQLHAFKTEYGQEQAEALILAMVEKLRESLGKPASGSMDAGRQAAFRRAYLEFARALYDQQQADASALERYNLSLLLAEALVEAGGRDHALEALALYQELAVVDGLRQERQRRDISARLDDAILSVRRTENNPAEVGGLEDEFQRTLKHFGLEGWESSYRDEVHRCFDRLGAAGGTSAGAAEQCVESLLRAYDRLREQLLASVEVDANVIRGRARALMILERYAEAVPLYRRLIAGLAVEAQPDLYWQSQLEFARCLASLHRGTPDEMARLATRIVQLRHMDPALGGSPYREALLGLLAQARRSSEGGGKH